jgi:hypothetical protein
VHVSSVRAGPLEVTGKHMSCFVPFSGGNRAEVLVTSYITLGQYAYCCPIS